MKWFIKYVYHFYNKQENVLLVPPIYQGNGKYMSTI